MYSGIGLAVTISSLFRDPSRLGFCDRGFQERARGSPAHPVVLRHLGAPRDIQYSIRAECQLDVSDRQSV